MATLGPFTNLLVPAGKAGAIYFAKDVSPFFDAATFSRPDIDATSGATVIRDGVLIELAENEPDWSEPFAGGCPVLKMRPQAENIWAKYQLEPSGTMDFLYFGITENNGVITEDTSTGTHRFQYGFEPNFALNTNHVFAFYVRNVNGVEGVRVNVSDGVSGEVVSKVFNFDGTTNLALTSSGNWSNISDGFINLGGGTCVIWVSGQSSTGNQRALSLQLTKGGITSYTGDGVSNLEVIAFQAQLGIIPFGIIPGALTRSVNSFQFTDLITKEVIGSGGVFSFAAKVLWKDTGADVDILQFQTVGSESQITVRAKTGGNLILAYEDGGLTELGTGLAADALGKIGFSYDGTTLIFSVNGATDATATISLGTITKLDCPAQTRYIEFHSDIPAGFTPIALTEAQLNAETL